MPESEATRRRRRAERREDVLLTLGCTMCAVWLAGVIVGLVLPEHQLPPAVHGVILALVPLLFGGAALTAWKSGKSA